MSDPASSPYSPPQSEIVATIPNSGALASRWVRFVSFVIDGVVLSIILIPFQFLVTKFLFDPDPAALEAAITAGDYAAIINPTSPPFLVTLLEQSVSLTAFIAINWRLLPKGQTIGKKLMKIQIQDRSGSLLPVKTLILRRTLPVSVAVLVPFVGVVIVLIDSLLIFRQNRNTLHDDMANSKVVVL